MGCRQDLRICDSRQQETGLAASPNMYYVIVYPVRGYISMRVARILHLLSSINDYNTTRSLHCYKYIGIEVILQSIFENYLNNLNIDVRWLRGLPKQ